MNKLKKIKNLFFIPARLGSKEIKNKMYLEECLFRYGCKNFEVVVINYNDYDNLIPMKFTWQRDYIPWKKTLELV
jgi:hypothetical protein